MKSLREFIVEAKKATNKNINAVLSKYGLDINFDDLDNLFDYYDTKKG